MIYNSFTKRENIPLNKPIWACAFASDRYGDMALFQKPIQGEISDKFSKYQLYFVPYSKKDKILAKSKKVFIESRHYADTEEECMKIYNNLIDKEIKRLQDRIDKYKNYYEELNND